MYNAEKSNYQNDIDLYELYNILWSHKLLIVLSVILGVFYAGNNIINTKKTYTATATFKLVEISSKSDPSDLVAGLAVLGRPKKTSLPTDKVKGSVFIKEINDVIDLKSDPYFNRYNPNFKDPLWKSTLKKLIGWEKKQTNPEQLIWENIALLFNANVNISESEFGSVKISVNHHIPDRAAFIANQIMEKIIFDKETERTIAVEEQIEYMYETVAEALDELNTSQSKLKTFSIEYGALPIENFAAGSIQLDLLREQFANTKSLHEAIAELATLIEKNNVSKNDYISLQTKYPIVDQVDFRRILGQSEIISTWNWPSKDTVLNVLSNLSERLVILNLKIENSQKNAEDSGKILETYGKLNREATIAEANYNVLIERAKTQDVLAGLSTEKSEVYEYAFPPSRASQPKQFFMISLGAIAGLILGCVLALAFALKRQVIYSKNKLIVVSQAKFLHQSKVFRALKKFEWNKTGKYLTKNQRLTLRNITQELYKSNSRYNIITSLDSKVPASTVANTIACFMRTNEKTIAIVNLSNNIKNTSKTKSSDQFLLSEDKEFISIFIPNPEEEGFDMLSRPNFLENLNLLTKKFDRTFVCANNDDALGLSQIMENQNTFHILASRRKHSKAKKLLEIKLFLPIQGLLHD
ncbi:Wzz/FepE/Etk N-terminal domain-containing protein [Amylibacter sp.]|nr:Wzz/FepE/Etk N-terminal domain-containing protein [Amylibacter sp.]